ncbi:MULTISPECIES: DUF1419 domain-containing protein [Chelativorans]|jgi:hypothetical protein|uniref:DUF1419 domain-containing protein n=1 Tax=Chelativorans sp. (strain BNC1) TaxID=266779 RepID=Q11AF7_CHESB|nr:MULTISPECIES: DUF1419 domain-containing protein [Chelativorans]
MTDRPFRKIHPGVAGGPQMYELFNRGADLPIEQRISGEAYAGGWFEIDQAGYLFMLDMLPPLFMRTGMFGMSEFKAGNVTSVFFEITIRGRRRWFHGHCDLSDRQSPERMRAAIIAFETDAFDSMTRAEKLEAVWHRTHDDFKGIAGAASPDAWPPEHRGKRTILVNGGAVGTVLKLLENLTDAEIAEMLGARRDHG